MKFYLKRLIVPYLALSTLAFYFMAASLSAETLIMTLNALFVGVMFSITVTYGRVIFPALIGRSQYDDVRQLTFGLMLCFAAYGLSVYNSIYIRAADMLVTTLFATALQRWLFINGAIIQITAPDLGKGMFYGPDRKWLWVGLLAGLFAAFVTYYIQEYQVFKEWAF